LRMSARRRAMRSTPSDSATVTAAGKPSGTGSTGTWGQRFGSLGQIRGVGPLVPRSVIPAAEP
jgi:hypothetical protein